MSTSALIGALVAVAACRGSREPAFESFAREANPILLAMRPSGAMLEQERDPRAVVQACRSLEPHLELLESLAVARRDLETLGSEGSWIGELRSTTEDLLQTLSVPCEGAVQLRVCAIFCPFSWSSVVDAVEAARKRAAVEGVEIVSLRSAKE